MIVPIADCPGDMTIWEFACSILPVQEAINDIADARTHVFMQYQWSVDGLKDTCRKVVAEHGIVPWSMGAHDCPFYGGLAITCNPNHAEGFSSAASTLGTKRPRIRDTEKLTGRRKNSYDDTLGFTSLTEIGKAGEFGRITTSVADSGFTVIRGRLSALDSAFGTGVNEQMWHQDESIFENLRLNIPVDGYDSGAFGFEMVGHPAHTLELGMAYSWNTENRHRALVIKPSGKKRFNLVLGVSPWLRLSPCGEYWEPNEHFGKTHPFDILCTGVVTPCVSSKDTW